MFSFRIPTSFIFFFFNDTATTEIYTLSLHDALPIFLLEDRLPRNSLRLPRRPAGAHRGHRDHRDQHVHRSEEHTSELQSLRHLVCRLLLEKKNISSPPSPQKTSVLVNCTCATPSART